MLTSLDGYAAEPFERDRRLRRETFGALLGHDPAATARDPEIAALMREIAEDETRHVASLTQELSHR
jgi:hypothetical protein